MLCIGIIVIIMSFTNNKLLILGKRYKDLLYEPKYLKYNKMQNMIIGIAISSSAVYSFIVQNNSIYDILFYLFPLSILFNEIKLNNSLK
jgi:hypothetical protein